jgi:hypothetical protein
MLKSSQTPLRCTLALVITLVMLNASLSAQKRPAAETEAQKKGIQAGGYYGAQPAIESIELNMYERIRAEGIAHGQAMFCQRALRRHRSASNRLPQHEEGE